jgi:hypothetical protein
MDLVYTNAMSVIGILFENGEWPELKEKMDDERVVLALNAFVTACLELKKADDAFAPCADIFSDFSNWSDEKVFTPEYWVQYRRLKLEFENAEVSQHDTYNDLLELLR